MNILELNPLRIGMEIPRINICPYCGGRERTVAGIPPLSFSARMRAKLVRLTQYGLCEQKPVNYLASVTQTGKCEQRNLPRGYTLLEYIESTGTQFINLGVSGNARFIGTAQSTTGSPTTSQVLVGNGGSLAGKWFGVQAPSAGTGYAKMWGLGASSTASTSILGTTKVNFDITFSNTDGQYGTVNDETISRTTTKPTQGDWYALIGDTQNLYYGFIGKLWSLKAMQNDVLVRDLVPANRNSDNAVGMYDKVSGTFFANAGTGSFTAGPAVTPTPDRPMDIWCNNGAIKVSPNLFDKNEYTEINAYVNATTGVLTRGSSGALTQYSVVVPCLPNTTYTISGRSTSSWGAFTSSNIGTVATSFSKIENGSITTGPNDIYLIGLVRANQGAVDYRPTLQIERGSTATPYMPYGEIYADGTAEVITDANGNTAGAANLPGVGNYADTQEIISGAITRNVGIKVLDGTENFNIFAQLAGTFSLQFTDMATGGPNLEQFFCTHLVTSNLSVPPYGVIKAGGTTTVVNRVVYFRPREDITTVDDFKAWIAAQYRAGTPVVIVYPLATATTESVAGQTLVKAPLTVTAEVSDPTITTTEAPVSTPDPAHPLPVWCNNGALKYGWRDIITTTQLSGYGTYVNPAQEPTTRAYRWFRSLQNGTYQFSVSGDYEIIVQWRDPADPAGGAAAQGYENLSEWMTSGVVTLDKTSGGYGIAVRRTVGPSSITLNNFDGVLHVQERVIYADGTPEVLTVSGANLANMVAENIDVGKIIYDNGSVSNSTANFVYNKYIPVEAGQNYVLYGRRKSDNAISAYNRICWYTANKGWISRATYTKDTIGSAVAPNNAAYARFTVAPVENSDTLTLDDVLDFNWTFAKATEEIPYQPYVTPQTANVEALLGVDDYKDEQEVLSGLIGRKVGVKVLTGQETGWQKAGSRPNTYTEPNLFSDKVISRVGVCSHFVVSNNKESLNSPGYLVFGSTTVYANFSAPTDLDTVQKFKAWLAAQYAKGDPVIVIYPLATPTTEQVAGQALYANKGTNTVDIQAEVEGIEVSLTYKD